eukprot:2353876-Amphidinium_carterae.1
MNAFLKHLRVQAATLEPTQSRCKNPYAYPDTRLESKRYQKYAKSLENVTSQDVHASCTTSPSALQTPSRVFFRIFLRRRFNGGPIMRVDVTNHGNATSSHAEI